MNIFSGKNNVISFFLVTLIVSTIGWYLAYHNYQRLLASNNEVVQSYQTIRAVDQSLFSINEAALQVSTFLYTDNSTVINNLPNLIATAQLNFDNLKNLIVNDTAQNSIYEKLQPIFDAKIEFLQQVVNEYKKGDKVNALKIAADPSRLTNTNQIIEYITQIKYIEQKQLNEEQSVVQSEIASANYFILLMGIVIQALLLSGCIYLKIYLK